MKISIIQDIAITTSEFMNKVINREELLDYEVLMSRVEKVFYQATEHGDDTIDIDYKRMCFTVHLDTISGQWVLCENATYYVMNNGLVADTIDIEL